MVGWLKEMASYGHILGIRGSVSRRSFGMSWSELKLDLFLHGANVTSGVSLTINAYRRSRNTKNMTQLILKTTLEKEESS